MGINNPSITPMSDAPRILTRPHITEARKAQCGKLLGEHFHHRRWPSDVVLAFLRAKVIKPSVPLARVLYPK